MGEGILEIHYVASEEQFQKMACNKGLTREEWECLREYCGLPFDEEFIEQFIGRDREQYVVIAFQKIRGNPYAFSASRL